MSNTTATVKFNRLPSQGVIYGFDAPAMTTLIVAIGVGAIAVIGEGLIGLLSTAPITIPLAILAMWKVHGQPMIVHLGREVGGMIRKLLGATKYRARPEKVKVTPESALDLPGREGRLHLYEAANGAVVVWDARSGTATVSAVVATPGLGLPRQDVPSTLTAEEREGLTFAWAQVLGSFTQKQHIQRVCVLEQTRPSTVARERRYFDEHDKAVHPDIQDSYREALDQADENVVMHRTQLTITFNMSGDARALVKGGGGGKEGMLSLAGLEMSTTEEALYGAGFHRVEWMNAREWGAWGRSLIDPVMQDAVDTRIGTPWEGVDPQAAVPMLINDERTYVETDSAWHRTYWVQEWPRYETYPGFMSSLVFAKQQSGAPVRHTFALVGSPVQVGQAMKRLDEEKRTWISNAQLRAKAGKPHSMADDADWKAIQEHESDLVAGQGELRFSAYLTVTSTEKENLEQESASMLNACSATGLEPRLVTWQQAEALMNVAYPCGLGMK